MFHNKTNNNVLFFLISIMPVTFLMGSFFVNFVSLMLGFFSLALIIARNKIFVLLDNQFRFLFLLFIIFFISSIFSDYKLNSFENTFSYFFNIILFLTLILFFSEDQNENKILLLSKIVFFITLFLCIDLWIQNFVGNNVFGYPKQQAGRLTSIFKDEQIPGGIILKLSIFSLYYLFKNKKNRIIKNSKFIILLFIYFSILITGERSSMILATILSFLLLIFNFKNLSKKKLTVYLSFFFLLFVVLFNSKNSIIKERFLYTIEQSKNVVYFHMYSNGIKIFNNNILLGSGPQTYRYECPKNYSDSCSTHPHNFLIELLSDGGILSATIFITSLLSLVFFKIKKIKDEFLSSLIISYVIILFFPLIPTGSFFSSFHMTLTWFSLGFLFSLKKI